MDSTDEDRHSPHCSRALLQPGLCREDQLIPIELESPDQQQLGSRDSDRGVSHSPSIPACPASTSPQSPLTSQGSVSLGGGGQVTLAETSNSTSPHSSSGILLQHVHGAQERRRSENLKYLNHFVKLEHFKMEGLHTVKALLRKNDWMAKIDLKDAFFMVPIAPQFHNLLLFRVGLETYQFKCLPFRLCTAPRVFTKTLKPMVEILRSTGIRLVIYIDDMLLMASSSKLLTEQVHSTLFLLENAGFIINNNKKSLLDPTQEIEFLGMIINSVKMDISLPGEKIKNIRQEAQKLLNHLRPSAHLLFQLIGKLNATTPALQMAPLFCRSLQRCLKQALETNSQNYQSPVQLSPQALEDLQWWVLHLSMWNGRSLITQQASLTITSDASLQGWGATCNGIRTRGPWSPQEQTLHINCLELLAATLAVQTFAKEKSGITILLKIDNTFAVAYINRMGGLYQLRYHAEWSQLIIDPFKEGWGKLPF